MMVVVVMMAMPAVSGGRGGGRAGECRRAEGGDCGER
jgi:hypothetical protein